MTIETDEDLSALKCVGAIVRDVLHEMRGHVRPGISTAELDAIGGAALKARGARSAPKLAYDFPGHTCISVNDEVAHGIPCERVLRRGDLVNIDVSAEQDGYWADTGASIPVGVISHAHRKLCSHTRKALHCAIGAARAGQPLNAIGRAVESQARQGGFNIIPELSGHGVGRFIHEPPSVLNFFDHTNTERLSEGLVIAIEPFFTPGDGSIVTDEDGWTLKTSDGARAAQYEHTVVITRGEAIVLT